MATMVIVENDGHNCYDIFTLKISTNLSLPSPSNISCNHLDIFESRKLKKVIFYITLLYCFGYHGVLSCSSLS